MGQVPDASGPLSGLRQGFIRAESPIATGGVLSGDSERLAKLLFRRRTSESSLCPVDPATQSNRSMNVGERIDTVDKHCRGPNERKSLRHFRGVDKRATKLCVDSEFSYEPPHQGVGHSPIWAIVEVPKLDVQVASPVRNGTIPVTRPFQSSRPSTHGSCPGLRSVAAANSVRRGPWQRANDGMVDGG